MFAQFDLKVVSLHREAIGSIELPDDLAPGCWREIV
jgi:16S rRNA U516 pseudouridylate synthase RsuA-like enzyme